MAHKDNTIEDEPLISLDDTDTSPGDHEYEDFPGDLNPSEARLPAREQQSIQQRLYASIDVFRDHYRAWKHIYMCGWLIVGLEIPMFIAAAPGIQLMEDAVCRQIYELDFSHDMCQGKDVQTKLAKIKGVLAVLSAMPSMYTFIRWHEVLS